MVIPERKTPSGVELADIKLHGGLGFDKMWDCYNYDGMSKEEIYGLAVHYYDEDSIKVDKPTPKVKVATSAKPTPKAESKSNVVDLFSKPKTEPKAEEKAQPKAKPQTKKEKALEGQLSLF